MLVFLSYNDLVERMKQPRNGHYVEDLSTVASKELFHLGKSKIFMTTTFAIALNVSKDESK